MKTTKLKQFEAEMHHVYTTGRTIRDLSLLRTVTPPHLRTNELSQAPSGLPFPPSPDPNKSSNLFVELASNALGDDLLVGPAVAVLGGDLGELVASREHASGPTSPAKVDVRVLVNGIELLAKRSQAARVVRATGLSENGLALVGLEPSTKSVEGLNVVGGASGVGAGTVGVEVLVDVEDEVGGGAVEVLDFEESGTGAVRDESGSVGPLVTGEEDLVAGGAGLTDGGHGGLNGGGPGVDVDVVLKGNVSTRTW